MRPLATNHRLCSDERAVVNDAKDAANILEHGISLIEAKVY
jgi:hypothetical protein